MSTRPRQKLEQLQQRVDANPSDALLQYGYGCECAKARRYEDAILALRKAIRLQPDYSAAYRELGRSLQALERVKAAKHIFQEGIGIAQRTGDIQTVREMKTSLKRLEGHASL